VREKEKREKEKEKEKKQLFCHGFSATSKNVLMWHFLPCQKILCRGIFARSENSIV
jgi:hypothetical protein